MMLEVPDAQALARFYSRLLEWPIDPALQVAALPSVAGRPSARASPLPPGPVP